LIHQVSELSTPITQIWGLGNICGDSPEFRDHVLSYGIIDQLIEILVKRPRLALVRNATWTLSNCIRGKPRPPLDVLLPVLPALTDLVQNFDDGETITDAL